VIVSCTGEPVCGAVRSVRRLERLQMHPHDADILRSVLADLVDAVQDIALTQGAQTTEWTDRMYDKINLIGTHAL
jgi:hypothetical protein